MDLKELRKSKRLTQEEASRYLDIPLRTYKRIENDDSYKNSLKYTFCLDKINEYKSSKKNKQAKSKVNKIVIAGIGYVGLSLGVLLSSLTKEVVLIDILKDKVNLVNKRISPIKDKLIEEYLPKVINLRASLNKDEYKNADIVIIATPTDFDENTKSFNTSSVESVIKEVHKVNPDCLIVIKSTVPISFTNYVRNVYSHLKTIFSPEFLREGNALYDNLYPSRIIIGSDFSDKDVDMFASLLESASINNTEAIYMSSSEAEATKLFSNAYLAMRVAYFNELDTYAFEKDLSTENIIKGMSKDPRIGNYYNNPSFGFGGYCLPKDSAQLSSSFKGISNNNLITAIVESNKTRKEFIVDTVINLALKNANTNKVEDVCIGIYKMSMKTNSDNYRSSSSLDIYNQLNAKNIDVIIYDENYPESEKNFDSFINKCNAILANRLDDKISPYIDKVLTRDLYSRD